MTETTTPPTAEIAPFPSAGTYDVYLTPMPHQVRTGTVVRADTPTGFARATVLSRGRRVKLVEATAAQYAKRPLSVRLHNGRDFSLGEVMTTQSGEVFIARKLLRFAIRSAGMTSYSYMARGPRLADEQAAERARQRHGPTMLDRLGRLVGVLDHDAKVPEGSDIIWSDLRTGGYGDTWYCTPDGTVWLSRTEYDWPTMAGPTTATKAQVERVAKLMAGRQIA